VGFPPTKPNHGARAGCKRCGAARVSRRNDPLARAARALMAAPVRPLTAQGGEARYVPASLLHATTTTLNAVPVLRPIHLHNEVVRCLADVLPLNTTRDTGRSTVRRDNLLLELPAT